MQVTYDESIQPIRAAFVAIVTIAIASLLHRKLPRSGSSTCTITWKPSILGPIARTVRPGRKPLWTSCYQASRKRYVVELRVPMLQRLLESANHFSLAEYKRCSYITSLRPSTSSLEGIPNFWSSSVSARSIRLIR
ncbi:hypothetical protein BDN67DRAFT_963809 [Paxillus ammoniavirescens]|nr:hypothetical protein BDN67DRAFT_963809 [Paxillus ammoniavirescens]